MISTHPEDNSVDAVVLAAGKGKRMRPFSNAIAKPMLPLLNKPLLGILAERLVAAGVGRLVFVVSEDNRAEVKTYFDTQLERLGVPIAYVVQNPPKGTADAIYQGGLETTSAHVLSVAGDNLLPEEFFSRIITEHLAHQPSTRATLTLQQFPAEELAHLSSVAYHPDGSVDQIVEKPTPEQVLSEYASLSMYVFQRSVLNYFGSVKPSPRGELEAPDAFLDLLAEGQVLRGCINKNFVHISSPADLWRHNLAMLVPESNEVDPSASVSDEARLTLCVVGANAVIGEGCVLHRCVVLPNTIVPAQTTLQDSVVGSSPEGRLDVVAVPSEDQ